jgi:hypothetical protein
MGDFRRRFIMKLFIRIAALTLIVAAAVAGNTAGKNTTLASNIHSSVPGGGGPMPSCNPFISNCPTIR